MCACMYSMYMMLICQSGFTLAMQRDTNCVTLHCDNAAVLCCSFKSLPVIHILPCVAMYCCTMNGCPNGNGKPQMVNGNCCGVIIWRH